VTPKVELKNLGWDSNVFNEAEDPKSDFTVTAGAPIDWWLRFGRGRLHGLDYFEGVYFATYGNQSAFNQRHERLRPQPRAAAGGSSSTSDRTAAGCGRSAIDSGQWRRWIRLTSRPISTWAAARNTYEG
jgi:hypothetical protein